MEIPGQWYSARRITGTDDQWRLYGPDGPLPGSYSGAIARGHVDALDAARGQGL